LIKRGSAKTNSELSSLMPGDRSTTSFGHGGLVPNNCLCAHFVLDTGPGFIDVS